MPKNKQKIFHIIRGVMLRQFGPPMSALGLQDIIKTVSIIICIGPTGLRLRHTSIGKTDPCVAQSDSAFARAASPAQLVLALGPSPCPAERSRWVCLHVKKTERVVRSQSVESRRVGRVPLTTMADRCASVSSPRTPNPTSVSSQL